MVSKYLLLYCLLVFPYRSIGQPVITIGPMLHYYFGETESKMSLGFEVACWIQFENVLISVDLGVESQGTKTLIYSELQTGAAFYGASFGPCLELDQKEKINKFGVQGTLWTNFYLGVDYRFRYIDQKQTDAGGIYFKFFPFTDFKVHM